ncbi:MAG: CvpA family protein [Lachnospiraceae bacterium]|nr:CvpA family protein [Lachnospiraceae bacterium]
MMKMTWLGIVALIVICVFCYQGYRRGFVKEAVSLMFVALSIMVVWTVNPYVNKFLKEKTPIYEKIEERCEESVSEQILKTGGTDDSTLLDSFVLPESVKKALGENNNVQGYSYLAAETFSEYVAQYLATIILNGLSFLLSYAVAAVLIRMVAHGLDVMSHLPVLNGINHVAGAAVGILKSVIIIWIALLVLTVLCNTLVGKECLALVEKDPLLSVLYEKDLLVRMFLSIF